MAGHADGGLGAEQLPRRNGIAILLAEVDRLTGNRDASHRTGMDRMQQAIIDLLQAHNAPADFIARIVEMEYP